ncbi:MAG TPA: hypothetical protein VK081_15080 [Planctomycetota bacterium]|nr:hypothetical protein [Planctomycetota bacterium]
MLHLADDVALRPVPAHAGAPARSAVLRDGAETGAEVSGAVLEGAVAWNGCRVLFTTDGVPAEDFLHVTFLDERGRVCDRVEIGAPYTTGSFGDLELLPPDRVAFTFAAGDRWVVRLFDRPRLRLPLFGTPPGARRGWRWRRRFALRRVASPEGPRREGA